MSMLEALKLLLKVKTKKDINNLSSEHLTALFTTPSELLLTDDEFRKLVIRTAYETGRASAFKQMRDKNQD